MRVGSKGHSYVMLEDEPILTCVQWVSRPEPLLTMAFTTETDKLRTEAIATRPAKKLKTNKTHCYRDNIWWLVNTALHLVSERYLPS